MILLIIFIALILICAIIFIPRWQLQNFIGARKDKIELINNARKTLIQVIGGALFLGTLFISYQTFVENKESNMTNRFTESIQLLNNENTDVKIAGIFTLEQIATERQDYFNPILNVLLSHIKNLSPNREYFTNDETKHEPRQYLRSIDSLKRNPTVNIALGVILNLHEKDTNIIEFTNNFFYTNIISNRTLKNIKFNRSYLDDIEFRYVNFENVEFEATLFNECSFYGCIFTNCTFSGCYLIASEFRGTGEEVTISGGEIECEENSKYRFDSSYFESEFEDVSFYDYEFNKCTFQFTQGDTNIPTFTMNSFNNTKLMFMPFTDFPTNCFKNVVIAIDSLFSKELCQLKYSSIDEKSTVEFWQKHGNRGNMSRYGDSKMGLKEFIKKCESWYLPNIKPAY